MRKLLAGLLLAALGWLAWTAFRPESSPPGAFLSTEPRQTWTLALPFKREEFTIYPLACFQVDALVLGRMDYRDGDFESRLAPYDLALGWGSLAEEKTAASISVTQGGRFYHWRGNPLPLPMEEIIRSSANMHIIPADGGVERFIAAVRPGQKVSLKGKLVAVRGPDRWGWVSSLTRLDSGDGACEVFFVEQADVIVPENPHRRSDPIVSRPAVRPASRQPAAPRPSERTVVLPRAKTLPIPYGSLTIPAGESVRLTAEKGSKVKLIYRGVEFWTERAELE